MKFFHFFLIADSENVKLCQKLEIFKVFTKFLLDWIRFQTLQEFTLQIPLFLTTFLVQTHDQCYPKIQKSLWEEWLLGPHIDEYLHSRSIHGANFLSETLRGLDIGTQYWKEKRSICESTTSERAIKSIGG